MSQLVIDASMALSWCFQDEYDDTAADVFEQVRTQGAVAPSLWDLEVVNALLVAERRGRVSSAESLRMLTLLHQLPIVIGEFDPNPAELLTLARAHQLSAYDATYLLYAMKSGGALATRDQRLVKAATTLGVAVI